MSLGHDRRLATVDGGPAGRVARPRADDSNELLQLQRLAGNRAVSRLLASRGAASGVRGVVSRKAELGEGKYPPWTVVGRADFVWRTSLTWSLIEEWNATHPNRQLDPSENLSDAGLDRCHTQSWDEIRHEILIPFLNGLLDLNALRGHLERLYGDDDGEFGRFIEEGMDTATRLEGDRQNRKKPNGKDVTRLANILNSGRANLRIDDHAMNIIIQQHADPHLVFTGRTAASGEQEFRATPRTKTHMSAGRHNYKYSPLGSRVGSSSEGGRYFSRAAATPETGTMLEPDA